MHTTLPRWALLALLTAAPAAPAQAPGNLLRNGDFQDDWLTLVPETKNHHWCYSSEFYNRRDFNPDGWSCAGSWEWRDAAAPRGGRRLVLRGPSATIRQRVNAVLVHDDRVMGSMADAGGYPSMKPQRSRVPERLVRDLTVRVRLRGRAVPAKAGAVEVSLCPPGDLAMSDPLGTLTPPTASATSPLPEGTYAARWVEVTLPAAKWLEAARAVAAKDPGAVREGLVLPGTAGVSIRYQAAAGEVELERAELIDAAPAGPNLLPDGGFESLDAAAYPAGWGAPVKYRYFPGRLYYLFNTWHNSGAPNRGPVSATKLVRHGGVGSLQMIVTAGDEKAVASRPVVLNQKEPRLIEVRAWVKTDRLCMFQIDAANEKGERLDGCNIIHMAPNSVGTDDWRLLRQVFRPRAPAQTVSVHLCARGVNGYTLDDTGTQPQNNVAGTVWWDDVQLFEPESTPEELLARGVKAVAARTDNATPHLEELDLGERLLGDNVLRAAVVNPGAAGGFALRLEFTSPSGQTSRFQSPARAVPAGGRVSVELPYTLTESCPTAYTEYRGSLALLDGKGEAVAAMPVWFGTWTAPIDLELGALYLQPEQKQFVRLNLGLSAAAMARLASVRLEVVRRGTGEVLRTVDVAATPEAIRRQLDHIPAGLREDFTNLLLADLDVSFLPVQPFRDPQRNWLIRAHARDRDGKTIASAASPPFCRLAHDAPQPPVATVAVKNQMVHVNDRPWMPWGAVYGHVPVYDGPADPGAGKYLDLHNLPAWSMYDRFTAEPYTRRRNDFNCLRYIAGSISDPKTLQKHWAEDNLYCSSAFVVPDVVWSPADLQARAGGRDKLDAYLTFCRTAPMVVSLAPGIEEGFGLFHAAGPEKLRGLEAVADLLRRQGGRPVMVGHGGYWNRLEFEKVPFFDIYDPETEPLYPANLHTDLAPLPGGQARAVWLRPQMYEDVPYERWRFHAYVELMRGCRGWQTAHGPGDQSLFRGLHGEMAFLEPVAAAADAGPKVAAPPGIEHWSRRHGGKLYVLAATTRGLPLGRSRPSAESHTPGGRSRLTEDAAELRDETNSYGVGQKPEAGPSLHGVQYLPDARSWVKGSKLVQWVRLGPEAPPRNLVILVKVDGRWTRAALWGGEDPFARRGDADFGYWFLNALYRHAKGFLGWDRALLPKALGYIPEKATAMGPLPEAGRWVRLEVPLDRIGAAGGLLGGVAFLHEGGRVWWQDTRLIDARGNETVVWGDSLARPPEELRRARIEVAGLKAGTKVRVLFEDRELTAGDGFFDDDFRGQDLYQRFGGYGIGYGDEPVALHAYEVAAQR
jgi:hypothetical protein